MTWQQIAGTKRFLEDERGTVIKDWGGRLPIALVFPNKYYLGMSNLAVHTLYQKWNARDDTLCERVFTDLAPPLSLETGAPLDYFPVIAFSIAYEMDYFQVVSLLRASGIPLRAGDRDESHPLLIAGGPAVSANPEPLAPLLDAIVIGEVEPILAPLTEALHRVPDSRQEALETLGQLPGLYLPHVPAPDSDPRIVRRLRLDDLDSSPTHSVLFTPNTEFANMGLIEIARGCGRGCRFCLAGYVYRPPRQRSVENILEQAKALLSEGDRLGLVSAAVSDYAEIDRLTAELRQMGARLSVSSMRVDPVSEPLVRALAESGTRTITIAPEAGSERLRKAINKTQTEDDVLHAVELAARYDFEQIKLYFMLGLPGEDREDVQALVDLALACAARFPRQTTVNITPFVPKAHTPFQRKEQTQASVVKEHISYVEQRLRRKGIGVKSESPAWAEVQGTLARGDRRLAEALMTVGRLTPAAWRRALAEAGLSMPDLLRERTPDETLPWNFIKSDVRRAQPDRDAR